MEHTATPASSGTFLSNRWFQLFIGIVGMIAVTNLQYGWTFFVEPIARKYGWSREHIQWGFAIFVLTETWLVPIEAYLADRFGSRRLVFIGGILVAAAWLINGAADSLGLLYLGNALGGAGAGIVYGISMGNALRWFPDRRGLAAGLTAGAFGAGSALTVVPIQETIARAGYELAFVYFGLIQGGVVMVTALLMRTPRSGKPEPLAGASGLCEHAPGRDVSDTLVDRTARDYTPLEMLRTPAFWLMYVMMTLVTVGGLMAIAQLGPMAHSIRVVEPAQVAAAVGLAGSTLGSGAVIAPVVAAGVPVGEVPFWLFGFTITVLSLTASVERVLNGLTRPFFGWISDHIGREWTMFLAFNLEAAAIFCLVSYAHVPILFVIFSGLTFFGWGEIYSLFPALCGDMFGRRYATTNYALLYTAKGTASLLVPLGSFLHRVTQSWTPIFYLALSFDVAVALLALFVLRPLRRRRFQ
jgi:OFA family oxalate/formate antiporter-like MFS transporter